MNPNSTQSEDGASCPVGPFVREQILSRLREALRIGTEDLSGRFDHFRDLLTEVMERVDAVELPHVSASERVAVRPSSRLAVTALSAARGEPVSEFLLIPFGEIVVERPIAGEDFVFTAAHAEAAKRWFDQMDRKLAVDYEHQSFDRCNTRSDGLKPAAGWIGGLEVRDDGLWAVNVDWTDRARELLGSGEYRYFSPVIFWTDEDHTDVAALGPVALTNDPAMRGVCPLAAARDRTEPALEPDAGDVPEDEPVLVSRRELEAAEAEIGLLRKQLAAQEADAFIERGLRLGKIVDSTSMDWRADYLRDRELAEERLSRAPVLLPPGRVVALDRRGEVQRRPLTRSTPQQVVGMSGQQIVETEDLAAYERAAAAGRVLQAGR